LLTRPLKDITAAARNVARGSRDLDLDRLTLRGDETGELARAFGVMVGSVAEKERELDQRAEQLSRSNQELSQFAYVASHDLQEPLRMVASFMSLLRRRYADQLNAEANEFIDFAVDGAERMKSLINDLLGYSRISNSPLHLSRVRLSDTLAGILVLLRTRIEEAHATVSFDDMPVIQADAGQMERLFRNLIDNALKYRSDAAPDIRISAERLGDFWSFAISDNGIGIDPIYAEKIFAIFSRLHSRDKYQGTGIGLAACRKIVERHGGTIHVEENPTGGSVFRFTLSATLTGLDNDDGEPQERTPD
jgi:light-regulated signal transduction histidine kinase (bacteriophytochrome)